MYPRRSVSLIVPLAILLAFGCGSKVTDDTITTNIKAKMFSDALLKSSSVNVASKDGIVTLTGVVPDDATRAAARTIASRTNGVKQVIDSTTLAAPPPPVAEAEPALAPEPKSTPPPKPAKKKAPKPEPAAVPPIPASNESAASDNPPEPAAPPAPAAAPTPPSPPPPPPPPQPVSVTIPEGSILTIRTIDSVDSKTSSTGQTFKASLDAPVVVNDNIVLPRGLNVRLKLIQASSAGSFKGKSELTISLDSVTYQGKTYSLETSDVQQEGSSRGKRSAAVIGGGAALGALIGGLAGGGRGAAIGAGVGAGGGTAVQAATKGQQVKIPSETRLDFTLHAPLLVTYLPAKKSTSAPAPNPDQTPPSNSDQTPPNQPPPSNP